MKYTYKRETFLYIKSNQAKVIIGFIATAIGLVGSLARNIGGLMLFLPGALLVLWGIRRAQKDCKEWHNYRDEHMKKGICFRGTVVDWGGHKYWEQVKYKNHSEKKTRHTYSMRESDWWVEVEYIDSEDGETKRFKAQNMNKKGKYMLGKRADVYLYKNHIYINFP